MTTGYQVPPQYMANDVEHRRQIAQAVGLLMQGKSNSTMKATLAVSSTTTTLTDARIGASTFIGFSPLSANAAAALAGLWVSAQKNGQATLTHASTATTDRTFNVLLIG